MCDRNLEPEHASTMKYGPIGRADDDDSPDTIDTKPIERANCCYCSRRNDESVGLPPDADLRRDVTRVRNFGRVQVIEGGDPWISWRSIRRSNSLLEVSSSIPVRYVTRSRAVLVLIAVNDGLDDVQEVDLPYGQADNLQLSLDRSR